MGGACQLGVSRTYIFTHCSPSIKVLQVVRVLPDIDADDGYMSEKRILIGCGDNFKNFRLGIPTLPGCEKKKTTSS